MRKVWKGKMMIMMMMMMIMSKKRGRRGFECVCACVLGGVRGGPGGEGECDIMEKTFHSPHILYPSISPPCSQTKT